MDAVMATLPAEMISFTTVETAELTGMTRQTLYVWKKGGVLSPSIRRERGAGTKELYSMEDVTIAKVLQRLSDCGASTEDLKAAAAKLRSDHFRLRRGPRRPRCRIILLRPEHQPEGDDPAFDPIVLETWNPVGTGTDDEASTEQMDKAVPWVDSGFAFIVVDLDKVEDDMRSHAEDMDKEVH